MAIAEEGMKHSYGANVGKVLLAAYGDDVKIRARAKAAAGSDARMNGCELPVVINSGSGNQGITVSVPVIEYARELGSGEEQLYRALLISNLTGDSSEGRHRTTFRLLRRSERGNRGRRRNRLSAGRRL